MSERMKLVQIHVHFEYTDVIDAMLDRHGIAEFTRYSMMEGKDRDGKHYGTQVFPGNLTIFQAQVLEHRIDDLFAELERFRSSKPAHRHLQALVLPIERRLTERPAAQSATDAPD